MFLDCCQPCLQPPASELVISHSNTNKTATFLFKPRHTLPLQPLSKNIQSLPTHISVENDYTVIKQSVLNTTAQKSILGQSSAPVTSRKASSTLIENVQLGAKRECNYYHSLRNRRRSSHSELEQKDQEIQRLRRQNQSIKKVIQEELIPLQREFLRLHRQNQEKGQLIRLIHQNIRKLQSHSS